MENFHIPWASLLLLSIPRALKADADRALEGRREGGYTSITTSRMELFVFPLSVSLP